MASEWIELSRWVVSLLIPAVSGLCGVWIGARLTDRREIQKRRYDFITRQLDEFYAPLLGLRTEIRARSELRVRISGAANDTWQKLCAERGPSRVEAQEKLLRDRGPQFSAIIDHDNKQLREALLPAYRKMADTFRDRLSLAEEETRQFYPILFEFIEIWDRFIAESLPGEVVLALGHGEEKLYPFYEHLKVTHDKLRTMLATGDV